MANSKDMQDEKMTRLKEMILANPNWGRRTLAKKLREEYKTAYRITTVAKIKEQTLFLAKIPIDKPSGRKPLSKIREIKLEGGKTMLPEERLKDMEAIRRSKVEYGFIEAFHMLRQQGFLQEEIQIIFSASGVIEMFNSAAFTGILKDRRKWIFQQQKKGKDKSYLIGKIKEWLADGKHSPFDFLRDSYGKLMERTKDLIDFQRAVKGRTLSRVEIDIRKGKKARKKTQRLYGR